MKAGDEDYRAYVGPLNRYEFMGVSQFRLLTTLGLRREHKILDFGCGSLRCGKLLIPYLDSENYYGQDPNGWLIEKGIKEEVGKEILSIKKPNFSNVGDFTVGFNERFDFVIAQSVFSHTDLTTTEKGLKSIYESLKDDGIALVTIKEGVDYKGNEEWVYPACTTFNPKTINGIFKKYNMNAKRLYWFNPSQTWFAISKNKKNLPRLMDILFLLGGEEVRSRQFSRQGFFGNRIYSALKKISFLKKNKIIKNIGKKILGDIYNVYKK